jgi:protein SCO1/2
MSVIRFAASHRLVLGAVLAAGLAAAIGGTVLVAGRSEGLPDSPAIGGPFTLENPAGRTVTDRDLRGRYALIYFGYTFCPDVCPTTLNEVAGALLDLGRRADRLTPVFITVDPHRDTPQVIGQYVAAFSPRLLGLTGTPDQVAQAAREYRVYYARHPTGPGPDDYSMDHSSILYLMDPEGRFVAPIAADESSAQMAADLAKDMS